MTAVPDPAQRAVAAPRRRITLRAAPRSEARFDDETDNSVRIGPGQLVLPFPQPARRPQPVHDPDTAIVVADIEDVVRRLLIVLFEVRRGHRPAAHLRDFLSPSVFLGLTADLGRRAPMRDGFAIRRIRVSLPTERVAEVAAVVRMGERYRAVALRLEVRHEQWRCTRLQIG